MSSLRASHSSEPRTFNAPVGTRLRVVTILTFGLLAVIALVNVTIAFWKGPDARVFWTLIATAPLGFVIVLPIAWFSRITGYRLEGDELHILRVGRINRFPLRELQAAESDPHAMKRARKLWGNDGLGAITGSFRSPTLGKLSAFLTDLDRSVVLRWPDRVVVISPDRTEEFVAEIRARAGLPR